MRVLIIEDDPVVGEMIAMYLDEEGIKAIRIDQGLDIFKELDSFVPDILVIDYLLPDINGIELCKEIRKISEIPIIIISVNTDVSNRIMALNAGADDYLCKPFNMKELMARIFAVSRRRTEIKPKVELDSDNLTEKKSYISIDEFGRNVLKDGEVVETTSTEYEIMKLFCTFPGRVFSREDLVVMLRGNDAHVSDRTIDVHILNLRTKIEEDHKAPRFLKTVWGVGYKFFNGQ